MDFSGFGYSQEDFREEAKELLQRAEEILSFLSRNTADKTKFNALFRTIHSLKGSASYVGLKEVSEFAHLYESLLAGIRDGKYPLDKKETLNLLVRARDFLEDLVFQPETLKGITIDVSTDDPLKRITRTLAQKMPEVQPKSPSTEQKTPDEEEKCQKPPAKEDLPAEPAPTGAEKEPVPDPEDMDETEVIRFSIYSMLERIETIFKEGAEKDALMKAFGRLEETLNWVFGDDAPDITLQAEELSSFAAQAALDEAGLQLLAKGFRELKKAIGEGLKRLGIEPVDTEKKEEPARKEPEPLEIPHLPEESLQEELPQEEEQAHASREDIVRITAIKNLELLEDALKREKPNREHVEKPLKRLKELTSWALEDDEQILSIIIPMEALLKRVHEQEVRRELISRAEKLHTALLAVIEGHEPLPAEREATREWFSQAPVNIRKVETSARSAKLSHSPTMRIRTEDLESLISTVSRLKGLEPEELEELQLQALQLRMIPVGEIFGRFRKVVRDLSQELGKPIRLEVHGEEVKLDKLIADRLYEPLLHLVRNAASHGIESVEERRASGKSEEGTIRLRAYQEGGHISIEVSDDGRGISVEKVRQKALQLGIVTEEELAELSARKALEFVFMPGFSTKDDADTLSGRGVGLDVVRDAVSTLHGSITVDTREGKGTTFKLELPLTLAIIKAMILEQGGAKMAIPVASVDKVVTLSAKVLQKTGLLKRARTRLVISGEKEPLTVVNLSREFGLRDTGGEHCLVIIKGGGKRVGLLVDSIAGRHPLTVKPLDMFSETRYFSSASLIGEEVVLIINVPGLVAA